MSDLIERCGCGGDAQVHTVEDEDSEHFGGSYIECQKCGITTRLYYNFKDDMVPTWNAAMGAQSSAEITRLTEALADGSFYKESDIDALQDKITSLTSALAASEEARRAERAAVVRECARKTKERAAYEDSFASLYKEQDPEKYTITSYAAHVLRGHTNAILALATDADNAALDKLLREARKAKKLKWDDFGEHGAKACAMLNSSYLIQLWRGRGEYELSVSVPGYGSAFDGPQFYPTLEAAKAAAQADYEARILAALEAPQ